MGCARHPSATVTIKVEPGIGVSATVIAPKELTYLGQHPTFTRPFVPSIIPSPSYFSSLPSHECSCCSPSIYHCKQHCCVIMVLGASDICCSLVRVRAGVLVCVCVCVCVCVSCRYIVLLLHEMVSTVLRALQSTGIFCQTNLFLSSAQQPNKPTACRSCHSSHMNQLCTTLYAHTHTQTH